MRTATTLLLGSLLACYGEITLEPRYNCQNNTDCPGGSRCAGIVTSPAPCTGSEGFGAPEENPPRAEPKDENDFFFLCINDSRRYPFCVADDEPLTCDGDIHNCAGTPEEEICALDPPENAGPTHCRARAEIRAPCNDVPCADGMCMRLFDLDDEGNLMHSRQCVVGGGI